MHESEIENDSHLKREHSLDDRRPRFLRDVVGQEHILPRLQQSVRNGQVPRLIAEIGPSGVGKTTLASILARICFCQYSRELGDCCGNCPTCRRSDLNGLESYHEWTGADLEEDWIWWVRNSENVLRQPGWFLFLDEAQDLSKLHQKAMLRRLESASAHVVLATTHQHEIVDALLNRFGANVLELRRPTLEQVISHMAKLCVEKHVQATEAQLSRAGRSFAQDLRKCVDFVYTAKAQTPNGVVTDEFLNAILRDDEGNRTAAPSVFPGVEL